MGQVAVPRLRAASGDTNENGAFQQRLQCWDRTGQNGDSVIATDYMPYISYHNMDNKIESCVFNGIWVLYGDEVYNGGNPLAHNFWANSPAVVLIALKRAPPRGSSPAYLYALLYQR